VTSAKLGKATLSGASLQLAAKHIPVKRNHVFKIVHPEDHMVDMSDIDRVSLFHDVLSIDSV
jgi:hypothetical protein